MAVFEINQGGGGDFTTIAAFEAAAAYGDVGQITDAGGTTYTENVTWSGASGTPSSSNDIRLEAVNEHLGVFGAGIIHQANSGHVHTISEDWLHFLGIEIRQNGTGSSDEGFRINADVDGILIERCLGLATQRQSDQDGIYAGDYSVGNNAPLVAVNCIFKGWARAGLHAQNFGGGSTATQDWKVHFCTFDQCGDANENESGGINIRMDSAAATINMEIFNTVAARTLSTFPDYSEVGGTGTRNWTGSHNAASDTSLTTIGLTTGAIESSDITVELTDPDTDDYSLANGSAYEGAGTDRTANSPDPRCDLTVDIAKNTRPATPSIGAFDVAAAGGTTGTGVATLAGMAAAATAALEFIGTAAQTLPATSASGAGAMEAQATGALSIQAVTASAAGEEVFAGTADQTLAVPLVSAIGEQVTAPVGTGAQTLASILGAATGQQAFIGDAASVLASLVADALAEHSPPGASGTAAQTLPAAESGASGETDAQRVPPDTVEASSNLRDTLTNSPPTRLADIDEKTSADDGEWWTAIDASEPIDVRVGFPAPASQLSGTQTIKARLRKTAGTPDPTVDLELWENGSFVKTLVSGTAITATDPGQVVSGTFDPTDVSDPALVEVRIVSTPGSA